MIDEAEFTRQYEAHAAYVLRYMLHKFGAGKAEDIASSAWMKAWKHRDQYNGRSSFKAWVVRIALNKGYEDHRSGHTRFVVPLTPVMRSMVHDYNVVERGIIAADSLAKITGKISPGNMKIFRMRYVCRMSVVDVAGELRMNVSTIKTRMRRALIKATK